MDQRDNQFEEHAEDQATDVRRGSPSRQWVHAKIKRKRPKIIAVIGPSTRDTARATDYRRPLKPPKEISLPMTDTRRMPVLTLRWQCYDRPGEKVRKQDGPVSNEVARGPDRDSAICDSRSLAGKDHRKRRRRIWQGLAPKRVGLGWA